MNTNCCEKWHSYNGKRDEFYCRFDNCARHKSAEKTPCCNVPYAVAKSTRKGTRLICNGCGAEQKRPTTDTAKKKHNHAPDQAAQCPLCITAKKVTHTPDTSDWEKDLQEEVAGSMTSKEATKHLVEHVRSLLEQAQEAGYADGCSNPNYNDGFEAGRTAALKEVVGMIEGMKKICRIHTKVGVECYSYDENYNSALDDLRQSLLKLINKEV